MNDSSERRHLVHGRSQRPVGRVDRRGTGSMLRASSRCIVPAIFPSVHSTRSAPAHDRSFTGTDSRPSTPSAQGVSRGPAPAIPPRSSSVVSPYVRYEELERWSWLADLVISEATAADILPRHVAGLRRRASRNARSSRDGRFSCRSRRRATTTCAWPSSRRARPPDTAPSRCPTSKSPEPPVARTPRSRGPNAH